MHFGILLANLLLLLIAAVEGSKVSYNCSVLPTLEIFISSVMNPSNKPLSHPVTSLVGIQDEAEDRIIKEKELRRELEALYGWTKNEVGYLGEAKNETNNIEVAKQTNAIFFKSVASCFENSDKDPTLFWVSTSPFQYNPPKLGHCEPKDQYLPVTTFTQNESIWFVNPEPAVPKKGPSIVVKNFGYSWKTEKFHHMSPVELLTFLLRNDHPRHKNSPNLKCSIPENDPLLNDLKKNLVEKFSTIKNSPTTKATWTNETFYNSKIKHGQFYKHTTDVFVRRLTIQPKTQVRVFQLVGTCGDFTVYTGQVYERVYNISGTGCIDYEGARKGTIEDCSACQTIDQCADESDFLKNHLEYDLWVD